MMLSGLLFLLIIALLITCDILGHGVIFDLDPEAKLQKINKDPKKFRISFALLITEHITIIALAVSLFIAFYQYAIILAAVWTISRITEGLINLYIEKNYWGLLKIAKQYSGAGSDQKKAFIVSGRNILKTKYSRFAFAQIFFSIGTLAYCILFVTHGVVPVIIGWFGISATILYGLGNGIILVKPSFKVLWNLGGLLILIFELILGGWLLFSPLI
jgi:hypothetical protein